MFCTSETTNCFAPQRQLNISWDFCVNAFTKCNEIGTMRDRERKIFWYELRHQLTQLCLYHLAVTAKSRVFAWSLHANKGHNWLDLTAVYVLYFLEQHLFQSLHFCTALSNLIGTWEMKREPFTTYPKWDPSFIHNLLLPKCLHLGSWSWIRIFVFNAYNSGNRGPT